MRQRLTLLLRDPDRRRAAGLSLLVHALLLLLLGLGWEFDLPTQTTETYLVIDLGTPELAETEAPAAADDAVAQPAEQPAVASDAPGRPAPGTPEPEVETAGDPTAEDEPPTAEVPAPPSPPQAAEASADAEETPQAAAPIPVPTPQAQAPEAAQPAPTPDVQVAVPEIDVATVVPEVQRDPLPVPAPSPEAVGGVAAVPTVTPEVTTEAREVTPPNATVEAPVSQGLNVPSPSVDNDAAASLDRPDPSLGTPAGRDVDAPVLSTDASDAQALGAQPTVSAQALRRVPVPTVQAIVRADVQDPGPGAAANVPDPDAPVGGDAARPGQVEGDPDAPADALGAAASPEGEEGAGGSPPQPAAPLVRTTDTPLAVILDNVGGYPQTGLAQASWIAEMPVEGGSTRLMAFFDQGEPLRVGPIRSARDYFVEIARGSDAVLVHVGGSPSSLDQLARGPETNLDAFSSGSLFARDSSGVAPYNTYALGADLRAAVARLEVNPMRTLQGFRPVPPPEDSPRVNEIELRWSGAYQEGFRYFEEQDRYRWIRQGEEASTAGGEAVQVDAVLVARILALEIPGDREGRLFIPLEGGEGVLYWRGAAIEGSWSVTDGLQFVDASGLSVRLEGLKVWASFLPMEGDVSER